MKIHAAYRKWFHLFSCTLMFWGVVLLITGFIFENTLTGLWTGLWTASWIITLISLSGIVFLALQVLLRAEWPRTVSRIADAMSRLLPAGITVGILSLIGMDSILNWSRTDIWMNKPFFLARSLVYFAGWICSGSYFIYIMRRAGLFPAPHYIRRTRNAAAIFLMFWGMGSCLAAWDLFNILPRLRPETSGLLMGHNLIAPGVTLILLSLYILLVIRILEEKGLLPFQLEGLRYVLKMKPDPGPGI